MWKIWWRTSGPILILGTTANCLAKELDWQSTVPKGRKRKFNCGSILMRTGHGVICSSLTRIKLFALLFKGKATAKEAICLTTTYIKWLCALHNTQPFIRNSSLTPTKPTNERLPHLDRRRLCYYICCWLNSGTIMPTSSMFVRFIQEARWNNGLEQDVQKGLVVKSSESQMNLF